MAERKRGLGRGLGALIPAGQEGQGFAMIPLDRVEPNPNQPRVHFDEEALESLAASLREVGILQPVVVRALGEGHYQLIAGERRWRAARLAGLEEIPAMVREEGESWSSLTEALVENVQREELSPLEQAAGYRQLMEDFGWTHEQVGARVGKSRSSITNTLRLLQLSATIQGMIERGELSAGHARPLVGVEDRAYADHIAGRAADEGWSVRMVEEAVRARIGIGEEDAPARKVRKERPPRPSEIVALEEKLSDHLETKVEIGFDGQGGRVLVRFSSLDELERIYRSMFG